MFLPFLSQLGNPQLLGPTAVRGGTYTRNKNRNTSTRTWLPLAALAFEIYSKYYSKSSSARCAPHVEAF